jgi:hypothetical protein
MEFRLTYEGTLLSESSRSKAVRQTRATNKQELRQCFHSQLKRLWQINPTLLASQRSPPPAQHPSVRTRVLGRIPYSIDELAREHSNFGYRFVPLATHRLDVFCAIRILILRPNTIGGGVLGSTGDIDNGFKIIFDALAKPRAASQLGTYLSPREDEDPFFCLLEDDKLISRASIDSDLLLAPLPGGSELSASDARVLVSVKLAPRMLNGSNAGFLNP